MNKTAPFTSGNMPLEMMKEEKKVNEKIMLNVLIERPYHVAVGLVLCNLV